jgi:isopentenyl diphosphate isomerase/L-lactate dehydrogenase-like FMN-dependent dehydrogenase
MPGSRHPEDALRAVEAGADGIVVSNHGGRQMDGAVPAVEALPAVVRSVRALDANRNVLILCDTGVRTSTDVVRLIALGADGVMMGRPPLWALMCGGSDALRDMLTFMREDIRADMQCLGWSALGQVPDGVVWAKND